MRERRTFPAGALKGLNAASKKKVNANNSSVDGAASTENGARRPVNVAFGIYRLAPCR